MGEERRANIAANRGQLPDGTPATLGAAFGMAIGSLKEGFDELVANAFDPRADVIDPGDADFRHPPPLVDDPRLRAEERSAREAARAPYRAPDAIEVAFTRVPTTGDEQLAAVAAVLSGLRPDDCFGVYRVPDRYDERRRHENKAYLEWEVVHAGGLTTTGGRPVTMAGFNREDHWVGRQAGDPPVSDEEMVGALVHRSGLGPEDCYGLTRMLELRGDTSSEGSSSPIAHLRGALAVTGRDLGSVQRELAAAAPLEVGAPPFRIVLLDWEAIAAWNAPKRWYPPRIPAPLPHLPGDPQELLAAYLEVVGIRPDDCFGAMVTRSTEGGLGDLGPAGVSREFRLPKFPCADGEERSRHSAAQHVVVLHRDAPAHVEGRERWAAYEADVLHARLSRPVPVGEPMVQRERHDDPFVLQVLNMFNPLDPMPDFPTIFNRHEIYQLGPYC